VRSALGRELLIDPISALQRPSHHWSGDEGGGAHRSGAEYDEHLLSDPNGPPVERKDPFLVWHLPHRMSIHKVYVDSAIREGRYKLIKNWDGDFIELYDLRVDIEERTNRAAQKPELAQRLEQTLMDYLERVNAEEPEAVRELAGD